MLHVPYKGEAPALVDLMGSQLDFVFATMPALLPHVKSGKLRALGVTGAQRAAILPQVPTISESGLKGYEVTGWYGLLGPSALPKEIVARLNTEAGKVMKLPSSAARLADDGVVTYADAPEAFAALIHDEQAKWAKVVRQSGIRPE